MDRIYKFLFNKKSKNPAINNISEVSIFRDNLQNNHRPTNTKQNPLNEESSI